MRSYLTGVCVSLWLATDKLTVKNNVSFPESQEKNEKTLELPSKVLWLYKWGGQFWRMKREKGPLARGASLNLKWFF